MLIGLGLHLGILISYPIPWFALGMCSIYLLMIPVSFWKNISNSFKKKQPTMTFFYDAECPLCNRTKIIIQSLDIQETIDFKTVQFHSQDYPLLNPYDSEDLLDNIYSIKNQKVYKGIDTYIQVLSSIFYLKPLSWFIRIPGIYHIGQRIYSFIATNRNTERCTEDNCGYTPPVVPPNDEKLKILNNFTLKDLKVKLITYGLIFFSLLQAIVSYNSDLNVIVRDKLGLSNNKANRKIENLSRSVEGSSRTLFGITHHAVFMDYHFDKYNHILATVYKDKSGKEIWLPTVNEDGTPGWYQIGFNWVKRTFRTSGNIIEQNSLESGLKDFTAFWAYKNNINLEDATFIIKLKRIETPKHWEKDFLKKQMEKPWEDVGVVQWKDNNFIFNVPDIEAL